MVSLFRRIRVQVSYCILYALLFLCHEAAYPQIVNSGVDYASIEKKLLQKLSSQTTDMGLISSYLELSNHYVYKIDEKPEDLYRSKQYALKAYKLSTLHHFIPGKNKAMILMADAYLEGAQQDSAKMLLPLVSDTSKIDIMASICRHYVSVQEDSNWADSSIFFVNEARKLSAATGLVNKEIYCTGLLVTACIEALKWNGPDVALVNAIEIISSNGNTTLARLQAEAKTALKELQLRRQAIAKRERDILLTQQSYALLKKDAEIKQASLAREKFIRNVTIIGILLLIIIIALLYSQYKSKKVNNLLIQQKNQELQKLLVEKEWLLKEIHHRVKNNLQTIVSLLESQSANLNDDALLAIRDSQNRVFAMSLIHQKLYQSDSVATTNMAAYLPELVRYLSDSFNTKQYISFKLQVAPVELDVVQAVPVGLIVNEAITNAIKYAFTGRTQNEVRIEMKTGSNNNISLYICDNGVGLPTHVEAQQHTGLGLKLINGLSEDLKGKFRIWTDNGTHINVHFAATKVLHTDLAPTLVQTIDQAV